MKIIKKPIYISICILFIFILAACGGSDKDSIKNTAFDKSMKIPAASSKKAVEKNPDIAQIKKNIQITTSPTLDGDYVAFITNNNDVVIDELDIDLLFYDNNNNLIDTEEDGHDVILPGHTVVSRFNAPESVDHVSTNLAIELGCYPDYENHSDDIDVKITSGKDCEIVQLTNNADVTIEELEYILVYYLGNDIAHVSYDEDVYDLMPGDTATEKDSVYDLRYDKCEIYLNQAHTFGL